MAKEALVTRTVTATKVDVFCIDKPSKETFNITVMLPGKFKDDSAIMKAAAKQIDTETVKAISIESSEIITELRGMTESEFLAHSHVLPPRKVYEKDTETVEA